MIAEQIDSLIESLNARAERCMANGERDYAAGLIEAVQALRRVAPAAVAAPEPVAPPIPMTDPLMDVEAPEAPSEPPKRRRVRKPKGV